MHSTHPFAGELRVLLKNFAGTLSRQILTALVQLTTVAIIARQFGPAGSGIYTVSLLLPMLLVTALNIGAYSANVYYLGSSRFSARVVMAASLKLSAVLGVIGMGAGASVIWLKADEFFPNIDHAVLWISLLVFPASLLQGFISSIFQGLQRFKDFNVTILAQPVATLVIVAVLIIFGVKNLTCLVFANLIGVAFALGYAFWLLKKRPLKSDRDEKHDYLRNALNYGYKAHICNVIAFIHNRADIFLVNMLISPAAAGIYSIAVLLCEKLWMLANALTIVLLPRLSELAGDEDTRVQLTTLTSRIVFGASIVGSLMFALIAYPLIRILFGEEYAGSYIPFLAMLPGVLACSCSRIIGNDIAARGRPELNMYMGLLALAANLAANFAFIPRFGVLGAALAATIGYVFDLVMKLIVYKAITNASFTSIVLTRISDLQMLLGVLRKKTPSSAQA